MVHMAVPSRDLARDETGSFQRQGGIVYYRWEGENWITIREFFYRAIAELIYISRII